MPPTLTEENYLKAVYHLSGEHTLPVSTGMLADYLRISAASVTDKLKRLKQEGLVEYQKSRGVVLSDAGMKIALAVIRKHRLWEQFLVQVLEFSWDEVHDMAEQLEHVQSHELIERLDAYMGHPRFDPHGDPIPDASGVLRSPSSMLLSEAPLAKELRIVSVASNEPEFLRFLDGKGLRLQTLLHIEHKEAYDGSLLLRVEQQPAVHLSKTVSSQIRVSLATFGTDPGS